MTTQTTPDLRVHYDDKAFRIHIVAGNKTREISVTEVLREAENSGTRITSTLEEFAVGPLAKALQIFPVDQALAPALRQAEAESRQYGEPVFADL